MVEWKDIEGFENYYEVSDKGDVRNKKTGLIKKKSIKQTGRGYYYVNLCVKGSQKCEYIHRLIAKAFIPNSEKKPCINHIDGDTLNNELSNLEWCTYAENMGHAMENNLIDSSKFGNHGKHAVGSSHGRTSLIEHEVIEIRKRAKNGESGRAISEDYPISDSAVYDIINRKSWTHI